MWFWIWTLLIVGALVCAFLVARGLWRKFRAVLTGARSSADRASEITSSIPERTHARIAQQPSTAPTIGADPVDLVMRVDHLRALRLERKLERRRPRPQVYARWLSIYR